MDFGDLIGQTAVITGGARGIGYALASVLCQHGVKVALIDLLPTVAESAQALTKKFAVETCSSVVDVTKADEVRVAFGDIAATLGVPRILITSAGIARWCDAVESSADDWRQLIEINLNGTFHSAQAFGRALIERGLGGSAIFIASMSGSVVNVPQHQASYNASKAAVIQLARSLAVEWAPHGIRVNCISPGYILSALTKQFLETNNELANAWTQRVPLARLGVPEDLQGLALLLASEASSYITGQDILVDGGYTVI